jgi:hypothetical protein
MPSTLSETHEDADNLMDEVDGSTEDEADDFNDADYEDPERVKTPTPIRRGLHVEAMLDINRH